MPAEHKAGGHKLAQQDTQNIIWHTAERTCSLYAVRAILLVAA